MGRRRELDPHNKQDHRERYNAHYDVAHRFFRARFRFTGFACSPFGGGGVRNRASPVDLQSLAA